MTLEERRALSAFLVGRWGSTSPIGYTGDPTARQPWQPYVEIDTLTFDGDYDTAGSDDSPAETEETGAVVCKVFAPMIGETGEIVISDVALGLASQLARAMSDEQVTVTGFPATTFWLQVARVSAAGDRDGVHQFNVDVPYSICKPKEPYVPA